MLVIRKIARLCELCVSVVNNRGSIILTNCLCELCGESRKPYYSQKAEGN